MTEVCGKIEAPTGFDLTTFQDFFEELIKASVADVHLVAIGRASGGHHAQAILTINTAHIDNIVACEIEQALAQFFIVDFRVYTSGEHASTKPGFSEAIQAVLATRERNREAAIASAARQEEALTAWESKPYEYVEPEEPYDPDRFYD